MKKGQLMWFVAVGAVLAVFMAGGAWADGHGGGHHGGGYQTGPPHHGGHGYYCPPRPVYAGRPYGVRPVVVGRPYAARPVVVGRPYPYVLPRARYYVNQYVYDRPYYVPAPVQRTYYVPYATTYVAPPPAPGFSLSAIINEPGFSLGINAGN